VFPGQHLAADRGDAGPDDRGLLAPGLPGERGRSAIAAIERYWGFDHAVHQGGLVMNASAAASLTVAFRQLFAARVPDPADAGRR
jgi:hypothetical protein